MQQRRKKLYRPLARSMRWRIAGAHKVVGITLVTALAIPMALHAPGSRMGPAAAQHFQQKSTLLL